MHEALSNGVLPQLRLWSIPGAPMDNPNDSKAAAAIRKPVGYGIYACRRTVHRDRVGVAAMAVVGLGKARFHGGRGQDEAPRLKVSNPGCRFLCRRPSGHRVKRGGRRGPAAYDRIPGFPAEPHVPRPRPHLRLCCGGTAFSLMVMPRPPP